MASRNGLVPLALALGFVSTTAQVIILRELLVAFTGNELTIATTFAIWLLAVSAGSLIFRSLSQHTVDRLPSLFIIAGVASFIQVISIRLLHPLASTFGEVLAPGTIILISLAGVLPSAVLFGGLFVALVGTARHVSPTRSVALVYGMEALGSGVAGLLLSIVLLEALRPAGIMGLVAVVCLGCGAYLVPSRTSSDRRIRFALVVACLAALAAVVGASGKIDLAARHFQWKPLNLARTVDSKYGNIVVTNRDSTFDFFESGTLAFTIPDLLYAEECAHIPLLHHPEPHNVLLVGGAGSGIVREVLKHPSVRSIDFVELDPALVSVVHDFAPKGWLDGNARASVTPYYGDAREYVAKTMNMYDVAIVSAGMPTSLQVNRFYTVEFFRSVERVLDKDGILSIKIASPGAYVGPALASLAASLANACKAVFPVVIMLPGEYINILASPGLDLRAQTPLVLERLRRRGIITSYVNQFVLWDTLSEMRIAQLDSTVARYDTGRENSDGRPVSFTLAMSIWEKHFRSGRVISSITSWVTPEKCTLLLLVVSVITVGFYMAATRAGLRAFPWFMALYSMGFTTMFTQILVILGFQIVSGYIYGRMAAVVAAFMVGMGLASSLVALKKPGPPRQSFFSLLAAGLIILPLAVVLALSLLRGDPRSLPSQVPDIVFAGIAFLSGALGGAIFSTASALVGATGRPVSGVGALSYSLDLAGASVAGFATGFLLIPAMGLNGSAYAVSAFNLLAFVIITIVMRASSESRLR